MDQNAFFSKLGFKELNIDGEQWYEGPYRRQYRLKDTPAYIAVEIRKDSESKSNDRLRFYHIMKEEDMMPMLEETVQRFSAMNNGKNPEDRDFLRGSVIFPYVASYVRKMIEKDIGPKEWDNLCLLYDASVRAGGDSYLISEACKEVMKLAWMKPNEYVLPEMHNLLVKIPDAYFDFVTGVERNLQDREYLQKRLICFMKDHPGIDTIDVVIFTSFMNENDAMKDKELDYLYARSDKSGIFSGKNMKEMHHELLESRDKYGWRISTLYTHGLLYRIRHANSVIFVDYQDSAIGHAILDKADPTTAEILSFRIVNEFDHPGVREKLIEYTENVVQYAGFPRLIFRCKKKWVSIYQKLGYSIEAEDGDGENFCMIKELK